MAWRGDKTNPAPNTVKESIERSEKLVTNNDPAAFISNNRAEQVRRDTDTQKNFTVSLYDIDGAILYQLENLQIQVTDQGKKVNVPIFFGPPERWVSAQRDGYIRDKQGKVLLPAMILKRSSTEDDKSLMFFDRYLDTPAMKLYSDKNKYTKFNALTGQNAPINEVYHVMMPRHMVLTYHCIVWTAYVEQMNEAMETVMKSTRDYWGSRKGFRFRVQVDGGYSHTVELQAGGERLVRTEFDMTTHGYILPDSVTFLEQHKLTTQKRLTPKKFIMGMEVVRTDFDLSQEASNAEKWRNPNYPNLRYDTIIPPPGVSVDTSVADSSFLPTGNWKGIKVAGSPVFLRVVPPPYGQNPGGQDGDMSYDATYFYFRTNHQWKAVLLNTFTNACVDNSPLFGSEGSVEYNARFFYIYSKGQWRRAPVADVDLGSGNEGDIMYDQYFLYIYTQGTWTQLALGSFAQDVQNITLPPSMPPACLTAQVVF